jgi:hypothetical protein
MEAAYLCKAKKARVPNLPLVSQGRQLLWLKENKLSELISLTLVKKWGFGD